MKHRFLCILLILSIVFSIMPVFGASASSGRGTSSATSAYQYGVILEVEDYYAREGFLEVTILFPANDSFTQEQGVFSVTLSTLFNDTLRYRDMNSLYNALPVGVPIRFIAEEGTVGIYGLAIITELWYDITPVTYDPFNTYNPSTGFEALPNSAHLPVYRTEQWDDYIYFFAAYLDENHYYSIDAYDYGIFVNGMWAIEEDMYSIDIVELLDTPDKNFTATMDFYVTCDIENATLCAELYNTNGNRLQKKTGSIIEYEGSVSFTDVPDAAGTHIIKAWLQSGNQTISPVYKYTYNRTATPSVPEPDTYALIADACVDRDVWSNEELIFVRIVLPDYDYGYFDLELSPDLYEDITDLDAYCESLTGSCGKFAFDDSGCYIVSMEVDSTGTTYENKRYLNSGAFDGQKELPIYSLSGGNYVQPVLNQDALYDITVYDHGIVITYMEYATIINPIDANPGCLINDNFLLDICISCESNSNGSTLRVQLLDTNNKVLEEKSVPVEGGAGFTEFLNYPNETISYKLKAWIENTDNDRISPVYYQDYATQEKPVLCGTIQDSYIDNSSGSNTYLVLKVLAPGASETTEIKCHPWTSVNKVTYSDDYATALENLKKALPIGTLIEYVVEDNTVSVIRFSTEKQQVVSDASYDEAESKVTATVTLVNNNTTAGTAATGTVYAGVYSKAGLLKGITTVPKTALSADGTATTAPVTIEGVTCEKGDYIKAFYWTADNAAISNAATAKISVK